MCCASVRPCCPAALLSRVWGWVQGACSSVEQEALEELSSTEASNEKRMYNLSTQMTKAALSGSVGITDRPTDWLQARCREGSSMQSQY